MRALSVSLSGALFCALPLSLFAQASPPPQNFRKGLGRHKEVELQIGTGHAILYRPLKEWVDLVDDWARLSAP
jgi:hypothetical protein